MPIRFTRISYDSKDANPGETRTVDTVVIDSPLVDGMETLAALNPDRIVIGMDIGDGKASTPIYLGLLEDNENLLDLYVDTGGEG